MQKKAFFNRRHTRDASHINAFAATVAAFRVCASVLVSQARVRVSMAFCIYPFLNSRFININAINKQTVP